MKTRAAWEIKRKTNRPAALAEQSVIANRKSAIWTT